MTRAQNSGIIHVSAFVEVAASLKYDDVQAMGCSEDDLSLMSRNLGNREVWDCDVMDSNGMLQNLVYSRHTGAHDHSNLRGPADFFEQMVFRLLYQVILHETNFGVTFMTADSNRNPCRL
jgi:hypothetical protein